jgi:hypothetical protein
VLTNYFVSAAVYFLFSRQISKRRKFSPASNLGMPSGAGNTLSPKLLLSCRYTETQPERSLRQWSLLTFEAGEGFQGSRLFRDTDLGPCQ